MDESFNAFGLAPELLEAIGYMGFTKPTEIQQMAIPAIIKGQDVLATAQTGTGKTASFVLPILDDIAKHSHQGITTLIIVPTRELALQIDQQLQAFSYFVSATSYAVYGGGDGDDWDRQKNALTSGTEIIIATPGKLLSHLNMGYINFSNLKHLILDEADRMLDMGFYDDITKIISYLPAQRQNLMFSATMPYKIRDFAKVILKKPFEINLKMSKPAEGVIQAAYIVFNEQKNDLLLSLIKDKPDYSSILIFTSTRRKVSGIIRALKKAIPETEGISSDLEQEEREAVMLRFKSKKTRVLVATDVLSRGIDIKDINLIFNYDVPGNAEDYVHRIGRTARADTTGVAITLVNPDDMYKFKQIERLIEREVPKLKLPESFGPGPEWNTKPSTSRNRFQKKGSSKSNRWGRQNKKRKP